MKNKSNSKSNRRDPVAGKASPVGITSSRRRFLTQTLAAGVAGVGGRGAEGQTAGSRVKPHKSPASKKDHTKKLPKQLKESMEWDFERFLNEIVEQIRKGKTTKQIEDWIYPTGSRVAKRQIVKTEVEGDEPPASKDHPLGVCLVAPIEWKMDGKEIAGFTIRGRMGRQLTGESLECDDYPTMDQTTAAREPGAGAFVYAGRLPRANPDQLLVAVGGDHHHRLLRRRPGRRPDADGTSRAPIRGKCLHGREG